MAEEEGDRELLIVERACCYLSTGKYPPCLSDNEKRTIRRKASKLCVEGGDVFYIQRDGRKVRFIIEKAERKRVLKMCHQHPTSGHFGIRKTLSRVTERFMWPGMTKDVMEVIRLCDICQRTNRKISVAAPELHPVPVVSPWYHIGIDLIGPISPLSRQGNSYILTISDYFTKFVDAIALPYKEAPTVASALFKVFMKMGLCQVVTSDQGKEFNNQLNTELMTLLSIDHRLTTPYHPQANGLDERFNQTIQNTLTKFIDNKKSSWEDYLDTCIYAYNTAVHESSRFTPYELMFGRKAILPIDLKFCDEASDTLFEHMDQQQDEDTIKLDVERRQVILDQAKANIIKAQQRQKEAYDKKHSSPEVYKIGAMVLKKDFSRKKRKGGKLDSKWLGPFTVVGSLGRGLYRLIKVGGNEIVPRVNGVNLKPYNHEDVCSDEQSTLTSPPLLNRATTSSKTDVPHEPSRPAVSGTKADNSGSSFIHNFCPKEAQEKSCRDNMLGTLLDQLSSDSLLRLWKTGASFEQHVSADDENLDLSSYVSKPGEYALSKDIDVALWLQYRKCKREPPLVEAFDFVIVSAELHNEFDAFKKAEVQPKFSYVPAIDLVSLFCKCTNIMAPCITKYESDYYHLEEAQLDKLIVWAQGLQQEHKSTGCVKLFRDEMFGNKTGCSSIKDTSAISHSSPAATSTVSENAPISSPESLSAPLPSVQTLASSPSTAGLSSSVHSIAVPIASVSALSDAHSTCLSWIPSLGLLKSDLDILRRRDWLNDSIIWAAQKLLKNSSICANIHSFQSPLIGINFSFEALPLKSMYLQILHVNGNHWIAVTNIDTNTFTAVSDRVFIYDSLLSKKISLHTLKQICSLVRPISKSLRFDVINVMRQPNAHDCGVLSIAFITDIALEYNPAKSVWDMKCIRTHLIRCLENKKFERFPVLKARRISFGSRVVHSHVEEIHCICRMPYDKHSDSMIECKLCGVWFHHECVAIDNVTKYSGNKKWYCKTCQPLFDHQ